MQVSKQDPTNQLSKDQIEPQLEQFALRQESQFQSLSKLQKNLKDQYLLLTTQHEQKNVFQKKLRTTLFAYYRSTVNMGESTSTNERQKMQRSNSMQQKSDKKYEEDKRLLEDQGFGDSYTFVKQVLLILSKDPYIMMAMIKKFEHSSNVESFQSLARVIVNSMYQNIVDDDVFNKDLLKIIIFCLKNLIQDKKHFFEINLNEEGLFQLILTQIIQRNEIKNYSKQIIKNTFLEVAKLDRLIDFKDVDDEQRLMPRSTPKIQNKESTKSQESPIKGNAYVQKSTDSKSKLKQYSEGLRLKDQKIRNGSVIRRKYRNCISDDLLNHLGITQQINFPCFSCGSKEDMKVQQEINRQLSLMFNRSYSKSQIINCSDNSVVKNVVLTFFNDLFKMLYSMPALIRISCKILYKYLIAKFNSKNTLAVIADFVINFWLASSLQIDIGMAEAAKLSPYLQKNIQQIIIIIKSIVKDNYKDIHPNFAKNFNLLVSNLKISIVNYVNEIVNIDSAKIDQIFEQVENGLAGNKTEPKSIKNIKSYCVCLNMNDIKKIIQMIKGAEKQIFSINDKIFKRVQRIQMMSQGNIFGDKKDKSTGKLYRPSKAYVLFNELALPSHLSMDYNKQYMSAFKNNKSKNVLRQVLLSLNDIQSYQQYYTSNSLQDLVQSLQLNENDDTLHSIDRIPLRLKLQYLQILTRNIKIGKLVQQLWLQSQKRFQSFKSTWEISKQCYLRAISSINFQNQRLIIKETHIRNQIKRRKLQQFCTKNQIKLCLTSPKTRQKQLVLKTTLMKDLLQQYKQKLWLQNQSSCIHTALNLDFIKSLTGQPEKIKSKYQSHINSVTKFSQILCALPQVKERFNMIEDTIGIKDVFFQFINFIRDSIKYKEQQYSILLQNIQWLQQNIQLKISKRLYEKLYPKHPLYDDISLYIRLKTLDWITFNHLRIDQQLRNQKMWDIAACHLRMIDKLRTAAQKLHCIQETNRIIVNGYMLMSKSDKAVSADDIYPLMILVLIRSAPKRLISSISFIQSFASQSKLLSKQGYCFTQLKAAIHFLDNLTAQNITLSKDEAVNYIQFNKKMYEKQIQYGIYFMMGRRKESQFIQKKKIQYLREYFKKKEAAAN